MTKRNNMRSNDAGLAKKLYAVFMSVMMVVSLWPSGATTTIAEDTLNGGLVSAVSVDGDEDGEKAVANDGADPATGAFADSGEATGTDQAPENESGNAGSGDDSQSSSAATKTVSAGSSDDASSASSVSTVSEGIATASSNEEVAGPLQPGTYGGENGYTYKWNTTTNAFESSEYDAYRDSVATEWLGIAGSFHITAFDTLTTSSHIYGNVLAKTMSGSNNFGQTSEYEKNYGYKPLSYVQEYTTPSSNPAGIDDGIFVIGSGNTVTLVDNGNHLAINDSDDKPVQLNSPKTLIQDADTAKNPFIDLNAVKTYTTQVSDNLAKQANVGAEVDTQGSITVINYQGDSGCAYVTLKASELNKMDELHIKGMQIGEKDSSADCSVVINVEMDTDTLNLSKVHVILPNGQKANAGESNSTVGYVMFNIKNSTSAMTINTSDVVLASVLAPNATINLGGTAAGTFIGNNVNVTAESHARPFRGTTKPVVDQLSVTKVWKDAYGNVEPADVANEHGAVTVKVYQRSKAKDAADWGDWSVYETVTLSKDNNWSKSWNNLPKKDTDGTTYEYKADEASETKDYITSVTHDGGAWTVVNRHVAVGKLTVTKAWDDSDNADNIRPESVTVKIVRSVEGGAQEDVETDIVLNEGNGWTYSKDQLPLNDASGNAYTYAVEEVQGGKGYTGKVDLTASNIDDDGNMSWTYTLTNSHESIYRETSVSVTKEWLNATGVSETDVDHDPVAVQLYRRSKAKDAADWGEWTACGDAVTLSNTNNWSHTWDKLVEVDGYGDTYEYKVGEVNVPSDYSSTTSHNGNTWTITNQRKVSKAKLTVTKAWDDSDNADKIRPDSVTVKIVRSVAGGSQEDVETGVVLNEGNDWTYTKDNLALKDGSGNEYAYSVIEDVPSGYAATYSFTSAVEADGTKAWSYTVTNTHEQKAEYTELSVTKSWLKANGQAESGDVVNAHGAVEVQLYKKTGNGQWAAEGDPVELNKGNQWTYSWSGLVKTDGHGVGYEYKVEEIDVPAGYVSEVTNEGASWKITNTRKATASLSIEKKWVDDNDHDNVRPSSVTVKITRSVAGGTEETYKDYIVLDASNGWKYSESGLARANDAGKAYTYSVSEYAVEGYAGSVSCTTSTDGDGNDVWSFTATNTHDAEYEETEVSVTKTWLKANGQAESDDVANAHGAVTVQLYKKVNDGEFAPEGDAVELSKDNKWAYAWTDLVKTDAQGNAYAYKVREVSSTEGYESSSKVDGNAWTIANKKVAAGKISVSKVWSDEDDADEIRPDEVTVKILRAVQSGTDESGKPVYGDAVDYKTGIKLDAENNWSYTCADELTLNDGEGNAYAYSVVEEVPAGYAAAYDLTKTEADGDGNTAWSYTVTNTHNKTAEYTDLSVTKSWLKANGVAESDDVANAHGAVSVQLYKKTGNGEFVAEGEPVWLSKATKWSHNWKNLVKTDAYGTNYTYDVREVSATEGYASEVTNDGTDFMVTNKKVATVRVAVQKTWSDNDDVDRVRPDELTVTVARSVNGVEDEDFSETLTLNNGNEWKAGLSGLAKTDAEGNEYTYSVGEAQVEGYTGESLEPTRALDDDGNAVWSFSLVNTHEQEMTSVSVKKAWDDSEDQDGLRPDSVTVKVYRSVEGKEGSELVGTLTLSAGNDWSGFVDELPVNGPDGTYTYSVEEVEVDGYQAEVELDHQQGGAWSFSLINKHEAATTSVDVKKVWEDEDDFDLIRPEVVKIQLGTKGEDGAFTALEGYEPVTLSKENNWGVEGGIGWDKLPVYANGKKINYTVRELDVTDGYEAKVSDGLSTDDGKTYTFTVTNTHTVETMEFSLSGYSVASITEVLAPDDVCYVDPKIYKVLQSHEGRQLTADEFKFQLVNEKTGEVVSTATNDASGMVDFDKASNVAPEGMDASCLKFTGEGTYTYVVKEISETKDATVSYSDEVVKFVVNITKDGDGKLISDGGKYFYYENAGDTTGTDSDADQHPSITNTVKGIVLGLTKVDGTGTGLAGATYGLYTKDSDGNDLLVATAASNASGKMTFGSVDASLLGEGLEYWYREISAPAGYKLSYAETTHFMVAHNKSGYYLTDLSGKAITDVAEPGVALELAENAVDEETSVVLNKVDSSLAGLKGAKLQVIVGSSSEIVDSWTSNGAGHKLSGLTAGTVYVLRETEAPSGYKKAADVKFRVNESGTVTILSGSSATVNGKSAVNAYSGEASVSLIDYRETETVKQKTVSRSIPQTGDTAAPVALIAVAAAAVIAAGLYFWRRNKS